MHKTTGRDAQCRHHTGTGTGAQGVGDDVQHIRARREVEQQARHHKNRQMLNAHLRNDYALKN
jgi:hypothetical protein